MMARASRLAGLLAHALALLLCALPPGSALAEQQGLFPEVEMLVELTGGELGEIVLQVRPDWAPIGAERVLELVDAEFYDDCRFFRVINKFMAQFGINGDPQTQVRSFVSLGTREKGSIVSRVVRRRRAPSRCFIIFSPF